MKYLIVFIAVLMTVVSVLDASDKDDAEIFSARKEDPVVPMFKPKGSWLKRLAEMPDRLTKDWCVEYLAGLDPCIIPVLCEQCKKVVTPSA